MRKSLQVLGLLICAVCLIGSAAADVKANRIYPRFKKFTGKKLLVTIQPSDAASARNLPRGTDAQRDKVVAALKEKGYEPVTEDSDDIDGYLMVVYKIYQTGTYLDSSGQAHAAGYAVVQFGMFAKKGKQKLWQAVVEYNPGDRYMIPGGMTLLEYCLQRACEQGFPLIPKKP